MNNARSNFKRAYRECRLSLAADAAEFLSDVVDYKTAAGKAAIIAATPVRPSDPEIRAAERVHAATGVWPAGFEWRASLARLSVP